MSLTDKRKEAEEQLNAVLVGMRFLDASLLLDTRGLDARLVRYDGKPMLVTRDIRENRVNLETEHGIVTRAYIG